MTALPQVLHEKFFSDPDWKLMEDVVMEYLTPLKDMDTVDVSQPAEHVKAEVIGRKLAYEKMYKFLQDVHLIGHKPLTEGKNLFK